MRYPCVTKPSLAATTPALQIRFSAEWLQLHQSLARLHAAALDKTFASRSFCGSCMTKAESALGLNVVYFIADPQPAFLIYFPAACFADIQVDHEQLSMLTD